MHVLITGAGGFIGRALTSKGRARGWKVTGVARRPCAEAEWIVDLRRPIKELPIPDAVIHLAGGYVGCGARELAQTDLAIARNLLAWGGRHGVGRWVFASAAEVYGDVQGEADENWPCRPAIPYGKVKLEIENLFRAARMAELTICRFGEVYGPGGRMLRELGGRLRKGFCPWPGDGGIAMSLVHVEDAADALVLACEQSAQGCEVYNVGDDEPATWRRLLDCMAAMLGTRGAFYLPRPVARCYAAFASWADGLLGRPPGVTPHVLRLLTTPKVLNSARLRDRLGFAPRYPAFPIGLKDALGGL